MTPTQEYCVPPCGYPHDQQNYDIALLKLSNDCACAQRAASMFALLLCTYIMMGLFPSSATAVALVLALTVMQPTPIMLEGGQHLAKEALKQTYNKRITSTMQDHIDRLDTVSKKPCFDWHPNVNLCVYNRSSRRHV
jgi:hypothetical protein